VVLKIVRDHAGKIPKADIVQIAREQYGITRKASVYEATRSLAAAGSVHEGDGGVSLADNKPVLPAGEEDSARQQTVQ
jgi:hypothetical protein